MQFSYIHQNRSPQYTQVFQILRFFALLAQQQNSAIGNPTSSLRKSFCKRKKTLHTRKLILVLPV